MNSQTEQSFRILPKKLISFTLDSLNQVAYLFVNLKIGPNALSFMALISGIGAGVLFFLKHPFWAGIMIVISGLFDILDGKVAVNTNQKSLFGAIFDSALDRYSEFFIYLGLAAYFRNHWALWLTFWTILGSSMVSYTRARAEGLGIECKIGIMQRAERMLLLFLGAMIGSLFNIFDPAMIIVLAIIAVFSNITAIQRTFYVKKVEKQERFRREVR
ncbi:MAG: CDP-alcohol phosphatidyltransferase family protein [Candidatus Aminicenantes bacterium]|nr:MAG: CDP-alcohol phosphatidyltransferase family protein [Candidatus Aminicenantes bacterium]